MGGLGSEARSSLFARLAACALLLGCNAHQRIITASEVPRCTPAVGSEARLVVRRVFLGSPRFRLAGARLELDHVQVYAAEKEEGLAEPIAAMYDGPSGSGPHTLRGEYRLIFRGPVVDKHLIVP